MIVWVANCMLASTIAIRQVWVPYMDAESGSYTNIHSDPFDGTIMPIAYIPDWTKTENQDKSKRFENISISEYIPTPSYDAFALRDTKNPSKASTILHYTYITPYMGNYRLDYQEYVGGHLGVDIRAPIGTPVLSIANGVIVRTVEADATWNRFIVVRHDIVTGGEKKTYYSCYLHLSEISVREGSIVKKWDMVGRVGMSGITTTPHLHLQIDTADAPFHPYWPFTSAEASSAGLSFFDAVNAGIGKDKALKYTIHPLVFINTYLWGLWNTESTSFSSAPVLPGSTQAASIEGMDEREKLIASYESRDSCKKKRYNDVPEKGSLGKALYPLMDKKCMFREMNTSLGHKETVTYREALINIMKFYDIKPANGTSHFLDIPLGDSMQWYAQVAYRNGILDGNYAYPDRILSREEFISLLVKIAKPVKNPSQIRIYNDVDAMNPNFQSIQDYGFMVRARSGKIYPKTLLSRSMMVQIFTNLQEKK